MESPSKGRRPMKWWAGALALALVALLTVAAVWHLSTYRSRRALARLKALNGMAQTAYNFNMSPGVRLQFGPLDQVYLLGPQTDDESLEVLDEFPRLRVLTLTNTRVTDEGLARLARFPNLNCVYIGNIDHTKIIGPAGDRLKTAPLSGGKGLAALKDLPNLMVVQLIGHGTTDEDVKRFAQFKHLELLDLKDTQVTPECAAKLRKALPKCIVRVR